MADKDRHISFEDSGVGIGQNADGSFDTFPLKDLPARVAARTAQEEADEYAYRQSEEGFPDEDDFEDDLDDISDLDDEDEFAE